MKGKKLFLLDVMPLLYRAHFATMGKSFGTTTGIDTRTTLVFFNYIFQILTEEKPDALIAALESKPKGRITVSSTYKANRERMPSEIGDAFPYALRLLEALKIPVIQEEGYEADDLIATAAKKGAKKGYSVFIVSPDKDFAQLVTETIFLFRPAYKGAVMETLDAEGVKNKYGVAPAQIADFLALRGDSVDNIIGVKGIGDKTAAALLAQFHSVEELLEEAENIRQPKIREAILDYEEQLIENKRLAYLSGKVKVQINWKNVKVCKPDEKKLVALLDELQFTRIKERLAKQGFIKLKKSTAKNENVASFPIREINLDKALSKLSKPKVTFFGFLGQSENRLFFMNAGDKCISDLTLNEESEWRELMLYLEKSDCKPVGWQLKPLLKKMIRSGIEPKKQWLDLSLAAYLLQPDAKIDWAFMKDRYQLSATSLEAPLDELRYLPCLANVHKKIMKEIEAIGLTSLLFNIEVPLQSVIARMELEGIKVDLDALKEIKETLSVQLQQLEKQLFKLAGTKFNLGSPSKTAEILEQVAAPSELKKTKTGQISTAEPFLIDLAPKYPFVSCLLQYRRLSKILTTYVESLPDYVDSTSQKIHPTFQQLVAGTGRLSCTNPNLQNLPVRDEAGREVRKAIIPSSADHSILSFDYNQVELRLLAALSEDKEMVEAFRSGKDIHTTTACRLFKVSEKKVTKEMRNKAKSINFGIAYGMTPWGLAMRLKIPQKEAKEIIEAYFREFASIKAYLEKTLAETRETGYTKTRYGRIRYIEGIDSRNGTTRKTAERMAVNAPLQGLAADIIKEAMVHIDEFIRQQGLTSRLVLQVHDELVFDAADRELALLVPNVKRLMENKDDLLIPLKVNVTVGKNWMEQAAYAPA